LQTGDSGEWNMTFELLRSMVWELGKMALIDGVVQFGTKGPLKRHVVTVVPA